MLAARMIRLAADALEDEDHTRWPQDTLIDYLNAGQRAVVVVRPDASTKVQAHQLAAGARQDSPDGAIRFMRLTRNLGADGTTPGRAITLAHRENLDAVRPGWTADTGDSPIEHYVYDPQHPLTFYVWPPAPGTDWYVEGLWSMEPADVPRSDDVKAYDADYDEIALSAIYEQPLLDFMLYRAYARDAETGNADTADGHLQKFYNALGVQAAKDTLHAPTTRATPYGDRPASPQSRRL